MATLQFKSNIPLVLRKTEQRTERAIRKVANQMTVELREQLQIPYKTHGPSKPGQYPHRRSGELQKIKFVFRDWTLSVIAVEYATYLQNGTINMLPRKLYNEILFFKGTVRPKWKKLFSHYF